MNTPIPQAPKLNVVEKWAALKDWNQLLLFYANVREIIPIGKKNRS